jgi:hypothetical protein
LYQISKCEEEIKSYGGGSFPKYVLNSILYHHIEVIAKYVLKGFASVKRCTECGRRSMERDIKTLK